MGMPVFSPVFGTVWYGRLAANDTSRERRAKGRTRTRLSSGIEKQSSKPPCSFGVRLNPTIPKKLILALKRRLMLKTLE
jgi:hypothetical protein